MWLNTAAYYDSNYEMINWDPHALSYCQTVEIKKKKIALQKLSSLSCNILREFCIFLFFCLKFAHFFFLIS